MVDLIEMVMSKGDMRIAALYDQVLVEDPQVGGGCWRGVLAGGAGGGCRRQHACLCVWRCLVRGARSPSGNTFCRAACPIHLPTRLPARPSMRPSVCLQERALGDQLRRRYMDTVSAVLMVTGHSRLCDNNSTLRWELGAAAGGWMSRACYSCSCAYARSTFLRARSSSHST